MDSKSSRPVVKRTRASGPKVRTGCLTCKSRHVKCDERKPECIRCSSTGRKCEGYLHLERKRSESGSADESATSTSSMVLASESPLKQINRFPNHSPKELRSIELFLNKAAPQLSGFFQQPFWNFVLQVSFDEISIRHALVAVSAVYEEDCMAWESPQAGTAALKKLSLDYYNRAIRSMVKKMQEKDTVIVPILGCILFVCFEFLRRDIPAAIKHIDGGIKMIEQARIRRKETVSSEIANAIKVPDYENEIVERVMSPLISSLNLTAAVFGRPGVHFNCRDGDPMVDKPYAGNLRNMEDAIVTLLDFINGTMNFLRSMGQKRYTPGAIELEDYLVQERLIKATNEWREQFDIMDSTSTEITPTQKKARNMLRAVQKTAQLWLMASTSPYETAWDMYKADFEELLSYIEDVVLDAVQFSKAHTKLFSFELGIIPPLELVIRKCRYPSVRRRALALLKAYPKRECLFDSFYAALLDERVVEMEEACFRLPPGCIPTDDQLPPEHERIHLVFFAYDKVPGVEGWLVSFLSKPQGVKEDWLVRRESIDILHSFNEWKNPDSPRTETSPQPSPKTSPVDGFVFDNARGALLSPRSSIAVTADA